MPVTFLFVLYSYPIRTCCWCHRDSGGLPCSTVGWSPPADEWNRCGPARRHGFRIRADPALFLHRGVPVAIFRNFALVVALVGSLGDGTACAGVIFNNSGAAVRAGEHEINRSLVAYRVPLAFLPAFCRPKTGRLSQLSSLQSRLVWHMQALRFERHWQEDQWHMNLEI